jgi:hypothetical protein
VVYTMSCRNLGLIGLMLVLVIAWSPAPQGQATKTFTGKITEIAKGTELNVYRHGNFYTMRLDEYPNIQFHISSQDAVEFGVIEPGGTTVLTPKHIKGLGWKVKLTCNPDNLGSVKAPVYRVTSLVKLAD